MRASLCMRERLCVANEIATDRIHVKSHHAKVHIANDVDWNDDERPSHARVLLQVTPQDIVWCNRVVLGTPSVHQRKVDVVPATSQRELSIQGYTTRQAWQP